LPIELSLLGKWQKLDVFEVINKVACDFENFAVNNLDLSLLLAFS
jgi:hypothetical protein